MSDLIDALPVREARRLLKQVRDILWPKEDPDAQWSPDHIASIADALARFRPASRRAVAVPTQPALDVVFRTLKAARLPRGRFWVYLFSVGNPDHGQFAAVSEPRLEWADSYEQLREHCFRYQEEWDLGGGNWPGAAFGSGRTVLGHVSFNGRLWEGLPGAPDPREIRL